MTTLPVQLVGAYQSPLHVPSFSSVRCKEIVAASNRRTSGHSPQGPRTIRSMVKMCSITSCNIFYIRVTWGIWHTPKAKTAMRYIDW